MIKPFSKNNYPRYIYAFVSQISGFLLVGCIVSNLLTYLVIAVHWWINDRLGKQSSTSWLRIKKWWPGRDCFLTLIKGVVRVTFPAMERREMLKCWKGIPHAVIFFRTITKCEMLSYSEKTMSATGNAWNSFTEMSSWRHFRHLFCPIMDISSIRLTTLVKAPHSTVSHCTRGEPEYYSYVFHYQKLIPEKE